MASIRSKHEGSLAVFVYFVDVCSIVNQQLHHLRMVCCRCQHEGSSSDLYPDEPSKNICDGNKRLLFIFIYIYMFILILFGSLIRVKRIHGASRNIRGAS
eukprot:GHVR01163393.1.p1 GENE.GHVR01163393.1~~GHVR01163393.1.p1  ORF type:complete len:100 (-),score=5.40 GHVR01163393.1:166-465(-)